MQARQAFGAQMASGGRVAVNHVLRVRETPQYATSCQPRFRIWMGTDFVFNIPYFALMNGSSGVRASIAPIRGSNRCSSSADSRGRYAGRIRNGFLRSAYCSSIAQSPRRGSGSSWRDNPLSRRLDPLTSRDRARMRFAFPRWGRDRQSRHKLRLLDGLSEWRRLIAPSIRRLYRCATRARACPCWQASRLRSVRWFALRRFLIAARPPRCVAGALWI